MVEAEADEFQNLTCSAFAALPDWQQKAFILGVANGRGMTAGLFEAYAGAARDMANSPEERESIAASYDKIRGPMESILTIDANSLLNGLRVKCSLQEFHDRFVIEALAAVHLDAVKALGKYREG